LVHISDSNNPLDRANTIVGSLKEDTALFPESEAKSTMIIDPKETVSALQRKIEALTEENQELKQKLKDVN